MGPTSPFVEQNLASQYPYRRLLLVAGGSKLYAGCPARSLSSRNVGNFLTPPCLQVAEKLHALPAAPGTVTVNAAAAVLGVQVRVTGFAAAHHLQQSCRPVPCLHC